MGIDEDIIKILNELGQVYGNNENAKKAIQDLIRVYNTLFPRQTFLQKVSNRTRRMGRGASNGAKKVVKGVNLVARGVARGTREAVRGMATAGAALAL